MAMAAQVRVATSKGAMRAAMLAGVMSCVSAAQAREPEAGSRIAPEINATYKLKMAGMELATFIFGSKIKGESYTLSGHGKLSWAMGLYKYNGNFTSNGRIDGAVVKPGAYAYDWRMNAKNGATRLGFVDRRVTSIDLVPPREREDEVVPLKPEHLREVYDPLSALIVLARNAGGEPCERRIGLFEGKQRFDLVLSRHREERIVEKRPSGQPVVGHVCRVRYIPIGGHKLNRETSAAIRAEGIEVGLRAVPSAGLNVPYRITIPTPLGVAVMTAQTVDIMVDGARRIALSH